MVICNDHGDSSGDFCSCDWGWYDNSTLDGSGYCSIPGNEKWNKSSWQAFQWIFFIMHCVLFTVSVCKLYTTLSKDKIKSCKRLIFRLFRSPRNLCLIFLACIGLLRALWIRFDPFSFNKYTNRTGDRILFESVYPFIYGLYSSVLLVWGGLYQGIHHKSRDPFRVLRKIIMGMMIIAFPISIIISVLKGKRFTNAWVTIAGLFVGVGILILIFGFIAFGILLYCYVEKQNTGSIPIPEGESISDDIDKEATSREISDKTACNRYSLVITNDKCKEKTSNKSWEEFISEAEIENNRNEKEEMESKEDEVFPRRKSTRGMTKFISLITEDDRVIFRKLCFLMMISTIIGILVLLFIVFLMNNNKNFSSDEELGMIYGVFILELFSCWMIFCVFTAQIKVKDKKNLRYFSFISMKMNKKEPKIILPPVLKNIKVRLKNFYS